MRMSLATCAGWMSVILASLATGGSAAAAQQPRVIQLAPADAVAPTKYTRITAVRELSDGRVIIADAAEKRLVVTGWTGEDLVIGREGQGPGEYVGVGSVYPLAGDSSLFVEWPMPRYHILDDAKIIRTIGQHDAGVLMEVEVAGTSRSGRILGLRSVSNNGRFVGNAVRADSLQVLLLDPGGGAVTNLMRIAGKRGTRPICSASCHRPQRNYRGA